MIFFIDKLSMLIVLEFLDMRVDGTSSICWSEVENLTDSVDSGVEVEGEVGMVVPIFGISSLPDEAVPLEIFWKYSVSVSRRSKAAEY